MQRLRLGNCNVIANRHQPSRNNTEDVHSKTQIGHSVATTRLSDEKPTRAEAQNSNSTDCTNEMRAPRLLETRILIAMYNLRTAIEEIEAARLAGPTRGDQKRSLIVAVCSLESAMQNVDDAAQASKCLQMDGESDYDDSEKEDDEEIEWEKEEEAEFNRLLCCLNCYEEELDAMTVTTEDSTTARDKETNRILSELKDEEATLRSLMNMAVAIREQQVEEEGNNDKSYAPAVFISGSNNEGRHQCFSPVAPTCRLCGGSHWKYRCPP
ncbi:hypothetical protein IV203_032369 [Nitzschia inconspicua]|uniref:Uncharacterized protein n=1 Tax=Nitzschia inconspicua TaxID=303405 RepID=A0A9K3K5G1_9STRA|nr:hypothetical protein IV203_020504 [Nitzschia inconspicua]KAG7344838.1 hypothetical protein IV203_032369 [Nitzschia inconspicua]